MKNHTSTVAIILVIASIIVAGGTKHTIVKCKGVPSMPVAAACDVVSGGRKRMAKLCATVLHAAPPANSETSVYAYVAMEAAEASVKATVMLMDDQRSHNGTVDGDVREEYDNCMWAYESDVMTVISSVKEKVAKCSLMGILEYQTDESVLANCADGIRQAGGGSSAVYEAVLDDRDKLMIAYSLIRLAAQNTPSINASIA